MAREGAAGFHVFLSHNSRDKAAVVELAEALAARGLRPWLDLRDLTPGRPWQEELEAVIETAPAAAVIVGRDGLGPWEATEMRACLEEYARRELPVIPVLLPGAPEKPQLPLFLRGFTLVDLRGGLSGAGIDRLVWGITGEKPEPAYPDAETRELSLALHTALREKALLESEGQDTTVVIEKVLDLKRRLREGAKLRAGDLLDGRFELLEPIGRGGFAQVWKAYDQARHATVAVKVLHPQYTEDKTRRQRFFRGARQMAKLRHARVVEVVEEEVEDGGFHFFVMEYLAGGDFRQAVLDGHLSPSERLQVVLAVGEALQLAHERGVVHRDVKPHNLLLGLDGQAKLTDFDLVRAVDTTGGTRTSSTMGTFLYAAPEAMLDAKEAGIPADVYALGMTAVFALHGADLPPHVLWELEELLKGLDVNEECREVLRRAVARKAGERWPSVDDFCEALRASMAAEARAVAPAPLLPAHGEAAQEKTGIELVPVPGGEYVLGTDEDLEAYWDDDTRQWPKPRHRVRLSAYWIGKSPVTNEQYGRFLAANPDHRKPEQWGDKEFNQPQQPVVGVSWQDALAYSRWAGLDLPSEAQWEAAARGSDQRRYPWGNEEPGPERANYDSREGKTTPVGSYRKGAGPYGTLDQAGNVWEWCRDRFEERAYADRDGQEDPVVLGDEGDTAALRVVRGGSWANPARYLPAAVRCWYGAWNRHQYLGFRVVCVGSGPER